MANQEQITKLIRQYAENTISEEGYAELMAYLGSGGNEEELHDVVDEVWKSINTLAPYSDEDADRFYTKLIADKRFKKTNSGSVLKLWPRIAAVAAAVAMVVFGVWFFNYRSTTETSSVQVPSLVMNDIAPGKNGATLTLANGKVIQLSDSKSGVVIGDDKLAYNDGTEILRSALNDKKGTNDKGDEDLTASTTKGQTYIFTLPDGTKVWLNAASSLTIPSGFSGTETRKVELTGEAYFEVAKNKKRPFIVESNGQEVTVLGTHFNISAYKDEGSVKTTLLEGSVKVAAFGKTTPPGGHPSLPRRGLGGRTSPPDPGGVPEGGGGKMEGTSIVLKPNQQSVVSGSDRIAVKEVDINEAIAWKDGKFVFEYESIEGVMRKLARWYDAEIIYQGNFGDKTFSGSISRKDNISKILEKITYTQNVHFKIEGRRITVMP